MTQDENRIDRLARAAGPRRTFVAALAAVAVGLFRIRRAGAQSFCSSFAGVCTAGVGCCPGHACNYEFNTWVGRCGRITDEGGISPIESDAQVWAERITNRATFRRPILERRREERRKRRRHNRRR